MNCLQAVQDRRRFVLKQGFQKQGCIHVSKAESKYDGRYGETLCYVFTLYSSSPRAMRSWRYLEGAQAISYDASEFSGTCSLQSKASRRTMKPNQHAAGAGGERRAFDPRHSHHPNIFVSEKAGLSTLCVLTRAGLVRVSSWQRMQERRRFALKHGFQRQGRSHVSKADCKYDGRYGETLCNVFTLYSCSPRATRSWRNLEARRRVAMISSSA